MICANCDGYVPQGESALGLSTQGTLICASFKTMSRIINIVFAGMTTFIEVRIANYLYIAMFLPNRLLPEYGCESLFGGNYRQRMPRLAEVLIGTDFSPCSSSLRDNCFVLCSCDLGLFSYAEIQVIE